VRAEDVQDGHVGAVQDARGGEVQPAAVLLPGGRRRRGGAATVGEPAAAHVLGTQAAREAQR